MAAPADLILAVLFFAAALLYSTVGHGGASGYLAAMALVGMSPAEMRPTALVLNVLVSAVATRQFARHGHFRWSEFLPVILPAAPMAFLGGTLQLSADVYRPVVGVVLLLAAARALVTANRPETPPRRAPLPLLVFAGAAIGLLAGLTGVGGGIFLTPLLLFAGWSPAHRAAGVSAPFILVNSLAGLAGFLSVAPALPRAIPWWMLVTLLGGWLGARAGSRHFPGVRLRRALGVVLLIAGIKLVAA
jgi:uncharacterized membrane protein YfcA